MLSDGLMVLSSLLLMRVNWYLCYCNHNVQQQQQQQQQLQQQLQQQQQQKQLLQQQL